LDADEGAEWDRAAKGSSFRESPREAATMKDMKGEEKRTERSERRANRREAKKRGANERTSEGKEGETSGRREARGSRRKEKRPKGTGSEAWASEARDRAKSTTKEGGAASERK